MGNEKGFACLTDQKLTLGSHFTFSHNNHNNNKKLTGCNPQGVQVSTTQEITRYILVTQFLVTLTTSQEKLREVL